MYSHHSEQIVDIEKLLVESAVTLRTGRNSRLPILRLPVETLLKIVENVVPPLSEIRGNFRPFYRSNAMALSTLSPILHTCHKLRQIALSHANLWRTVSSSSRYQLPALPLYGAADLDVPLIAIFDGSDHESLLGDSKAMDVSRIQELHVLNLRIFRGRNDAAEFRQHFGSAKFSALTSLSISSVVTIGEEQPISLDKAPRLRHLVLQSVTFLPQSMLSNLTHLALEGAIYEPTRHVMTAGMLSRCPNLESLAISYPGSAQTAHVQPRPLLRPVVLNRLQRISLQLSDIHDTLGQFYLSLFPIRNDQPRNVPIALQILNHHWRDISPNISVLLWHATRSAASHLSLSMNPLPDHPPSGGLFIAISAVGPQGTFHIATLPFPYRGDTMGIGWDMTHGIVLMSLIGGAAHLLPAVREVWLSGVHIDMDRHMHIAAAFKTSIYALRALETIVFVEPPQGYPPTGPTLCLCPDAQRPSASPNLRTLRLVYGNDARSGWAESPPVGGAMNQLDLSRMLGELETGAYGYLDTLLLEMRPGLDVSPEDLERLERHFATVERRYYVGRTPTMPLADYCVEPCGGSGGTRSWLGSLW